MALWQTWSRKLRPAPTLGGVRFVPRALACQRHHQRLTCEMRLFVGVNWWARVVYLASFQFFFERMLFHGFWIYFAVLRVHWDMRRTMTQEPREVFGSKVVVSPNRFPRSNQQCPWLHVPASSHDSMHQPRSTALQNAGYGARTLQGWLWWVLSDFMVYKVAMSGREEHSFQFWAVPIKMPFWSHLQGFSPNQSFDRWRQALQCIAPRPSAPIVMLWPTWSRDNTFKWKRWRGLDKGPAADKKSFGQLGR